LQFQGEIVDNILRESISQYVNTLNINNSTQLAKCLSFAGVDPKPAKHLFNPLDSLMKRRHQIVHQMDRSNNLDPMKSPTNGIEESIIRDWKESLEEFVGYLMEGFQPPPPQNRNKITT